MKTYIGCKIIQGEPMSRHAFLLAEEKPMREGEKDEPGYKVVNPDGYVSWSPKEVFENAYRGIIQGELELLNPLKQVGS